MTDAPDPKTRRKDHEPLKASVIAAAATLLASGGKAALSARKLAAAVGTSTKIIYSHFGGMPGVISAVYAEAFARLASEMAAADRPDASISDRLRATADAYRAFALRNPTLFELMYGSRSRELLPDREDRQIGRPSLEVFSTIFAADSSLDEAACRQRSYRFWAIIHGPVTLETATWLQNNQVFDAILSTAIESR